MTSGITRDDWLRALDEANVPTENDQAAVTVQEFARMMDLTPWMAAYHLRNLHRNGRAVRTSKRGPDSRGRRKMLVAYRLIEPKAKLKTA